MTTAEEKLEALKRFTGDVIIYKDGSVSMYSTRDGDPDSWGPDWDKALDRLARKQKKA